MSIENKIPTYLENSRNFISHRLEYSGNSSPIAISEIEGRVFSTRISLDQKIQRYGVVDWLNRQKSNVVVVTATMNRPKEVAMAYEVLEKQKMSS